MMKICKKCGKLKSFGEFYYCANTKDKRGSWCKECDNKRRGERRARFCDDEKAKAHIRYIGNKDKINANNRLRHFERKKLLIAHYSGGTNRCACCGESNIKFLTIDHITGGGNKHRKSIGFWGNKFYCWLIKEGFPSGYQVLCFNCNMGRSAWGICPHQEGKLESNIH